MENLSSKVNNDVLTLKFIGQISSKNAQLVEDEAFKIIKKHKCSGVILDFNELEFISSAGLRIILKIKKEANLIKIINVPSSVYEILEMTGFSEIMNVEKAFRNINVDGCEVIGKGANGLVYKYDDETIVKVYISNNPLDEIKKERDLAKRAFVYGLPTAISYDVVKVGDKYGTVFELLNAVTLAKKLANDPEHLDDYADIFTNMLKKIHSVTVKEDDLPHVKDEYLTWVSMLKGHIDDKDYEKLSLLTKNVKDDLTLIHGDYHPKNIMFQNDEPIIIDLDTLSTGNIIFELSSTYLALVGFSRVNENNVYEFLGVKYEVTKALYNKLIDRYFASYDEAKKEEVKDKIEIVGLIRLIRRTIYKNLFEESLKQRILNDAKSELTRLLAKYDNLDI